MMEENVYNVQKEDYDMVKRRKNGKKWVFWLVLLALLVVTGIVVFLVWNSYFKDKNDGNQMENKTEIVENNDKGTDNVNEVPDGDNEKYRDEAEKVVEEKKVVNYEGDDPNTHEELTGVVTYAGVNGDTLMIRVNIDQYLDNGTCELSLEGSGMYSETANVVGSASTATCEGFNVPLSGLEPGAYQIVVRVNSGEKNGVIRGAVDI